MMETFIVLGLCFILYEALDFFQGCIHSATPTTSDQIDAYRRQLVEQRQQQQQEQFLANLTPLLGGLQLTASNSTTPTASTASVISDLRAQQIQQLQQQQQLLLEAHSASTPALNTGDNNSHSSSGTATGSSAAADAFRPANRSLYESQDLYATSSLPRDYYYLQQQQLKNKNSSKSLLSKFSSNSDNRIFPEAPAVLGVPAGVITTQPVGGGLVGSSFDCLPHLVPATPLVLDLKRAVLSKNHNNNNNNNEKQIEQSVLKRLTNHIPTPSATTTTDSTITAIVERRLKHTNLLNSVDIEIAADNNGAEEEEENDDDDDSSSASSDSASAGSASLAYSDQEEEEEEVPLDERDFAVSSCSSSHADFREIECERLRRKCVSVKRIYSISEKF